MSSGERILRVIDFETTGLPPDASVIEIGYTDVTFSQTTGRWHIGDTNEVLCKPRGGHSINVEAMAVHHIRPHQLIDCHEASLYFRNIHLDGAGPDTIEAFVAHNAKFERQFFQGNGIPWICTMRSAQQVWPESPEFSNQVLRYFLNIELDEERAHPPHRAGPDTYVTAHILISLLNMHTVADLIGFTDQAALLTTLPFGKHKGKPIELVPSDYMQWCLENLQPEPDVRHTFMTILRQRGVTT